jgi:hypothetical protein
VTQECQPFRQASNPWFFADSTSMSHRVGPLKPEPSDITDAPCLTPSRGLARC